MGGQNVASYLLCVDAHRRKLGTAYSLRIMWRKLGLPTMVEKVVDKMWTTLNWAIDDGEVPVTRALRSTLGRKITTWWRNRSAWGMKSDPANVTRWKHKFVGCSDVEVGGRRERLDAAF